MGIGVVHVDAAAPVRAGMTPQRQQIMQGLLYLFSLFSLSPRQQLLAYDPKARLSAKRALMHPYFEDLDKSALP